MKIASSLMSFLFPRTCHLCGLTLSATERYVCTACLARMPRTLYHRQKDNPMEQRFFGLVPFERGTGHFFYSRGSDLAMLMADLKYRKFRGLARRLGEVAGAELMTTGFLSDIDVLVPVPMHWLKQARRGYNQAEEICKGLNLATGITVSTTLRAVKGHRTQTKMTLLQRRANTSGLFRLTDPGEVDGKHVLLVDDVCTTGSTLTSAAESLLAGAPGAKVSLFTLGVTF